MARLMREAGREGGREGGVGGIGSNFDMPPPLQPSAMLMDPAVMGMSKGGGREGGKGGSNGGGEAGVGAGAGDWLVGKEGGREGGGGGTSYLLGEYDVNRFFQDTA